MKRLCLILLVTLVSCQHNNSDTSKDRIKITNVVITREEPDPGPGGKVDYKHKKVEISKRFFFSNNLQKDRFKVAFYGKNFDEGYLVFTITNSQNKEIYRSDIQGACFFDHPFEAKSENEKEKIIKNYATRFLSEKNFKTPAIGFKEKIETSFINLNRYDRQNWADIKSDLASIGYYYPSGRGALCGIAYDKNKNTVVMIHFTEQKPVF